MNLQHRRPQNVPGVVEGERAIYYLHGSGFALCSPQTHRRLTAWLSRLTALPARWLPEGPAADLRPWREQKTKQAGFGRLHFVERNQA